MNEKMMQESLNQFLQMASQDQELQSKLKAAPNREAYISSCVELGKEKGYSFTSNQVAIALDTATVEAAKNPMAKDELLEKELDVVAGGDDDSDVSSVISSVFSDVSDASSATSEGSIVPEQPTFHGDDLICL